MTDKTGGDGEGATTSTPNPTPSFAAAAALSREDALRAQRVIERCDEYIAEFSRRAKRMRRRNNVHQSTAVIAAGLTAVAAAVAEWPRWAVVLPAVVASIASNFIMVFHFRDKYVNFDITCWHLEAAKLRFETGPASRFEEVIGDFVNEVRDIIKAATGELREINRDERKSPPPPRVPEST